MNLPHVDTPIPVAVLGATGSVGQRLITLLARHPWFEVAAVCASPRSVGKRYADAAQWSQVEPLPASMADLVVQSPEPRPGIPLALSALDGDIVEATERAWADAGALVVTNAKQHRVHPQVPLIIPEVNPDHLALLDDQSWRGGIVANPNCSTMGLVLALAPLERAFGLKRVSVVTLQALSGAGLPGVPSMAIADNIVPYIGGEEDKLETEPRKILGALESGAIKPHDVRVSAACNRVAVTDGHTACVSVELGREVSETEVVAAWKGFRAAPQELVLPTAPARPVVVHTAPDAPQPRLHRDLEQGMAVSVGRLRRCPLLHWKFVALSHNTLRGAAGGALLAAELCVARGSLTAAGLQRG